MRDRLARANARLAAQARTDPLTGLLNHGAIGERTDATIGDAATRREIVSLRFFGIDHFKRINDTHGHQAVDAVLAAVARRASASLRAGDTVGRYGGEKFLVLLPATGATGALGVAERLRQAIADHPMPLSDNRTLNVTASFGIAALTPPLTSVPAWLESADAMLYAAKSGGRNCVRVAEPA